MAWDTNGGKKAEEAAELAMAATEEMNNLLPTVEAVVIANAASTTANLAIIKARDAEDFATDAKEKSTTALTISETVKSEFDRVVADAGGNNPEVVLARGNYVNLPTRLEAEKTEIAQQLAQVEQMKNFEVSSRWRKKQAVLCFTLDDGGVHDILTVMPALRSRGFVASTAIITKNVGNPSFPSTMSWSQIKELQDIHGWEITSHSRTHVDLTVLNDDDLISELEGSLIDLKAQGLDVRNLFLPYGRISDKVKDFAKRYYRSMRVSGAAATGKRLNYTPFDMYRVDSLFFADTTGIGNAIDSVSGYPSDTVDYFKYYIDRTIERGALMCFGIHSNNIPQFNRQSDFEEILNYIAEKVQSGQLIVTTYNEALNRVGNVVDTKDFKVGADGKFSGKYGKVQMLAQNEMTGTTPIKDIDENYVSIGSVTPGLPQGLPTAGGTLTTVKYDEALQRAYQIFAGLNGLGLYYQGFDVNGNPLGFRRLDTTERIRIFTTSLPSNHTLSDLTSGAVSYYTILSANAAGYPTNAAGLLIANRISANDSGCFEEYRLLNTNDIYTRRWDVATGTWTAWELDIKIFKSVANKYTLADSITNYPTGISYTTIQTGHAINNGFPENTGGTLETHNILTAGWIYQIYHVYNSTKTYKRVWKADNTWSNFVLYGG